MKIQFSTPIYTGLHSKLLIQQIIFLTYNSSVSQMTTDTTVATARDRKMETVRIINSYIFRHISLDEINGNYFCLHDQVDIELN